MVLMFLTIKKTLLKIILHIGGKKDSISKAPKDFFDENVEAEKEFVDIAAALNTEDGLERLTAMRESLDIEKILDDTYQPSTLMAEFKKEFLSTPLPDLPEPNFDSLESGDSEPLTKQESIIAQSVIAHDLADHLDDMPEGTYIPPEMLNYNLPWRKTEEFPEPLLDNFVSEASREKFRYDQQVSII